jgi:hypothetical protein
LKQNLKESTNPKGLTKAGSQKRSLKLKETKEKYLTLKTNRLLCTRTATLCSKNQNKIINKQEIKIVKAKCNRAKLSINNFPEELDSLSKKKK